MGSITLSGCQQYTVKNETGTCESLASTGKLHTALISIQQKHVQPKLVKHNLVGC